MIRSQGQPGGTRKLEIVSLTSDFVIAGGGLSGVCCAITAAREGLQVILVQDRPVLGGNASSEVRLWILGATSHMGNNNRWAREGGVIDEILVENLWRNPEGNPLILDSILLEKVVLEKNITLLLNTAVDSVQTTTGGRILSLDAFCSQNQLRYSLAAKLFCDASGDGIVGFLAGASFRMGAEGVAEFGEKFAPAEAYGELLGHSLYFYSRDAGRPIRYIPPAFAINDIRSIPRYKELRPTDTGCRLWWLEYGGRLDTVRETEAIKWELWKVAYGVWDYIKNSGEFPDTENLTLEWMGSIPGKRESRRFEGDYMLRQQDVVEQRPHADAVSMGGWAMDLHPADGVYSDLSGCIQWHSKGVYAIPYRTMYSRNVSNLFLGGRLISASHVAFGSTRVMATCAHNGQAVGMAAAVCIEKGLEPRALLQEDCMYELQQRLLRRGQYIPGIRGQEAFDLVRQATITASSTMEICCLKADGSYLPLDVPRALLLPVAQGAVPSLTFILDAKANTSLIAEFWISSIAGNYTPDRLLESCEFALSEGCNRSVVLQFQVAMQCHGYVFVILRRNPDLTLHASAQRFTGLLALQQTMNAAVAKGAVQRPPEGIGVDSFEFWLPERRPKGKNPAITITPALRAYSPGNVANGFARPYLGANAWVASAEDLTPQLYLKWETKQRVKRLYFSFDTDFDHPMESVLMEHPEYVIPFCVKSYRILDDAGVCLFTMLDNHQTRNEVVLTEAAETQSLTIEVMETHGTPATIFEVRCFAE
jgi:hypothetical protein